jgi:2-hydroxychromene-2-carboxylate isomerase/NAD(P)H-dependent FMN reductase
MRVLAVSGSLHARSGNRALLETAAAVAPAGVEVTPFEGLRELPPFDPDAEAASIPAVEAWREALRACDAVLVACPEYGFSLPGVLKNAIDWVIGSGELEGKVVGVTAAVSIADRGRRGLDALGVPLRAVSARVLGGRPIVRGPGLDGDVAALLAAIAREVERRDDAPRARLEVWFDFASTYSYPAVSRVEDLAGRCHLESVWRPFLLGPIFQNQGWSDSPFNVYPAKGRYMWRDLERECARAVPSLPFRRPSVFPRNGVLAARVVVAHEREPWCGRFIRAVFHAQFAEDRDIASAVVVSAILGELGLPAAGILACADSAEHRPKLRQQTERAAEIGIFGAPTFVVGDEIFWGNDRLEQAVDFALRAGQTDPPGGV